ncbi:MAG: LCP family protein [Tissierellia bacterium]|nr:LCP family protein [Tissierellia bacterium]
MKSFFKAFFTTIFVLLLLGLVVVAYYIYTIDQQEKDGPIVEGEKVSFLVLGVDSLHSKDAENARSDTIMAANMDLKSGKVHLISIPRDTYAEIKGYNNQKINHSYKYGGAKLTLDSVNTLLNTNIKYYIVIDYDFVIDLVNKMNGIEINVPIDMKYSDPTANPPLSIDLRAGEQCLNGEQAMGFLRFRKGYVDQDLGRVQAQQQFVQAMLSQIKKPSMILKAPGIISSYQKNTDNNIPRSLLVKMGIALRHFNQEQIETATLPGIPEYRNNISYFFKNDSETEQLLRHMNFK